MPADDGERVDERFAGLVDLASERVGGTVLTANDDFFAPKENLLRVAAPVFLPDEYTDRGKWMDGWETRRRRQPGHDWCVIRLGAPGRIRGVIVDTAHFRGNHPEACSLDGAALIGGPDREVDLDGAAWKEILPRVVLAGHTANAFPVETTDRLTHLRLNIYPDGGVARLRVYGEARPDWDALARSREPVDLASAVNGATILDCSDKFFSDPINLLMPVPPAGMHDGWETRRRRGPGHDWCVIRLGGAGRLSHVELDTTHFKGNYPDRCSLDGAFLASPAAEPVESDWTEIVAPASLRPDDSHRFDRIASTAPISHVRLNIYPDGGVARLRVYGEPAARATE